MYHYISQREARENARKLFIYQIAAVVLVILLASVLVVFHNYREAKTHELYALQNSCEWHTLYNGMEVCK